MSESQGTAESTSGFAIPGISQLKPEQIKQLVSLFAAMLLLVVIIAGIWMMLAESQDERLWVGAFAIILFMPILWVLWSLVNSNPALFSASPTAATEPTSPIAKALAESPEVPSEEAQATVAQSDKVFLGKEGDFLIEDVRPHWSIDWISVAGLLQEETGIQDPAFYDNIQGQMPGRDVFAEEHLSVHSPHVYTVVPQPGESRRGGWPLLIIQQLSIRPRLLVFVQNRFLPGPTTTLEGYAIERLYGHMGMGGYAPHTLQTQQRDDGRKIVFAEADAVYQNVEVNGVAHQDVTLHTGVVCLEGATRYYCIVWVYASGDVVGSTDSDSVTDASRLRALSESFRLTKPANPKAAREAAMREAQKAWDELVQASAKDIDGTSATWLADQFAQLDLAQDEDLGRAHDLAVQYLILAQRIGVSDGWTAALQEGLEGIQNGDPEPLRNAVASILIWQQRGGFSASSELSAGTAD